MSQTTDEEEEQTEEKHTGRSAFFAGVHRGEGDGFSGSYRGVPAVPHGGSASVKLEDIIGQPDCWCGQVYGHAWPGKDKGVPHPRGEQMSTAAAEDKPYLNPRDLKKFDRRVVRALCVLVNDHGIEYRIDKGSMHIFLTAPGVDMAAVTKLKVSASSPPEHSLTYIEKWAVKYVRPAKVEQAASALAERFNDPTKKPHVKPVKAAASAPAPEPMDPTPSPAPSAPPVPVPAPPVDPGDDERTPPEGYERILNSKGGESNFWKKTGEESYRCKDCDYTCTEVQQFSGHRRVHNQPMFARKRAIAYMAKAAAEMGIDLAAYDISTDAHTVVAKSTSGAADVARLERQVADLTKQLEKVTAERDDVKARFQLAKEAFSL